MAKNNKQPSDAKNQQKSAHSDSSAIQSMTHKAKSLALITTITAILLFTALGLLSVLDSKDVVNINNQQDQNSSSEEVSNNTEALDNFPEAVPVYQPTELNSQDAPGENENGDFDDSWNRRYSTDADTDALIGFYEDRLSQDGWEITDSFESNGEVYSKNIIARHAEQRLELTVWISEHSELAETKLGLSAIKIE